MGIYDGDFREEDLVDLRAFEESVAETRIDTSPITSALDR